MTEIEKYRLKTLEEFQKENKLNFKNIQLLNTALIHKSYKNESIDIDIDNERMEFLGDSVLNFVITDILYNQYPSEMEGNLSKFRAFIASGEFLYLKALKIELGEYLLMGKGEEISGGRNKRSLLSNAYEALIGALYLDGGIRKARAFINKHFKKDIQSLGKGHIVFDYKAALQEFIHNKDKTMPKYNVEKVIGPDHNREYHVSITIGDKFFGPEKARTKKEAEKKLAKRVLDEIKIKKTD